MQHAVMAIFILALVVPVASILIARAAWRAKLTRPRLFVGLGLLTLYLFAGWLMTRPIPTHAVAIDTAAVANAFEESSWGCRLRLALQFLAELLVASAVVVLTLRWVLSRRDQSPDEVRR